MEVSKLNNVLIDIQTENSGKKINDVIDLLIGGLEANLPEQIEQALETLYSFFGSSMFNHYPISNYKILQEIEGNIFFGNEARAYLDEILSVKTFDKSVIINELRKYQTKRASFIESITALAKAFLLLHVDVHFSRTDFEIGLLIPESTKLNTIKNVSRELNKFDVFLKTVKEVVGEVSDDNQLTFINKGSNEFFSIDSEATATFISLATSKILLLYTKILEIKKLKKQLDAVQGVKKSESEYLSSDKEFYKQESEKIAQSLLKEFVDKKTVGNERYNELEIRVKGGMKYLAQTFDKGIIVEITPPELETPDDVDPNETPENKQIAKAAIKSYEERMAKISVIKQSVELTKSVVAAGTEICKYLTEGENEVSDNKVSDSEEV